MWAGELSVGDPVIRDLENERQSSHSVGPVCYMPLLRGDSVIHRRSVLVPSPHSFRRGQHLREAVSATICESGKGLSHS